jgi:hypothetical protein
VVVGRLFVVDVCSFVVDCGCFVVVIVSLRSFSMFGALSEDTTMPCKVACCWWLSVVVDVSALVDCGCFGWLLVAGVSLRSPSQCLSELKTRRPPVRWLLVVVVFVVVDVCLCC